MYSQLFEYLTEVLELDTHKARCLASDMVEYSRATNCGIAELLEIYGLE